MELKEPSAKYLASPRFKQTEVGLIPEDWDIKPLREISPRQSVGLVINPSSYFSDQGTVPMLVGSHVSANKINPDTANRITVESNAKLTASQLRAGDLITVRVGAPGITAVVPPDLDGSNCASVMIIRRHAGFNSAWLAYLMNSPIGFTQIENVQYGTAQKQFNIGDAVDFLFPFPHRDEQDLIAGALSDADFLIESLEQLLTKKHQIKQGAMQDLLTGKRRLMGFSGAWSKKRLNELASIQRGASPRPIDDPIWFDENSSVGWVRISDVTQASIYLESTTQRLSEQGVQRSRLVPKGSLIMSICATVGRPVITKIDTCIHDGFVVFDRLQADQMFVYYVLRSIEDNWSQQGQTGSQMNLNTGLINSTVVRLPPTTEEQTAIANILSDMDTEITALEVRLTKARQLKQGMAQTLLTGHIRLVN